MHRYSDHAAAAFDDAAHLIKLISELLEECGPMDMGEKAAQQIRLLPLYGISEILSAQKIIHSTQRQLPEHLLPSLDPQVDLEKCIRSSINYGSLLPQYKEIIGLNGEVCGSAWKILFECLIRSQQPWKAQTVIDALSDLVIRFERAGHSKVRFAQSIQTKTVQNFQVHFNQYQNTPYMHGPLLLHLSLREDRDMES